MPTKYENQSFPGKSAVNLTFFLSLVLSTILPIQLAKADPVHGGKLRLALEYKMYHVHALVNYNNIIDSKRRIQNVIELFRDFSFQLTAGGDISTSIDICAKKINLKHLKIN